MSHLKCGGNFSSWRGTSMTLSATRAKALKEPGRYSDGGDLPLYIGKAGRKSWVLRITVYGRRRDIGLGGYPSVSLALACKKAADTRAAVAEGRDPVVEKHAPSMPTFREAAYAGIEQHTPGPDRLRRGTAGPHPDMDNPSGDSPAGASTNEDRLPMGNGPRLHGVQPGG